MSESKTGDHTASSTPASTKKQARVKLEDNGNPQVEVEVCQHWPNPDTGENILPGTLVTMDADLAKSLVNGGYAKAQDSDKK